MKAASTPLTIGIAACSAEGAALCYRTICTRAPAVMGPHAHPNVVLHSISLAEYVKALEAANLQKVGGIMLRSAESLAAAGADFLICPDNTVHSAMDFVTDRSPLPWLHIAQVVAAEARHRGIKKPCILGTTWLAESDVYPEALGQVGIDYMRPDADEQQRISDIIMNELVNDIQADESVAYFQALIKRMKARGCDAAVLGCTEIPIVINDENSDLQTLDSTRLLADAALRHAIAGTTKTAAYG